MDPKLEEVFKKWEAHSSGPSRAANDEESQRQREERQRKFRDNLEAPFRSPQDTGQENVNRSEKISVSSH